MFLRLRPFDAMARAALLAGLWWVLTRGNPASWVVGVPVILAATLVSGVLMPAWAWHWSWPGALRFAPFFLWHSFLGGMDVAWRALHPRLPLRPGFVTLRLRLPPGAARVCLANVVSLLPGTLSANLHEAELIVHAVDMNAPIEPRVRAVEVRVADLFGVGLTPEIGGRS